MTTCEGQEFYHFKRTVRREYTLVELIAGTVQVPGESIGTMTESGGASCLTVLLEKHASAVLGRIRSWGPDLKIDGPEYGSHEWCEIEYGCD